MDTRHLHDMVDADFPAVERANDQQRADAARRMNRIADEVDDLFTPLHPQHSLALAEHAIDKCLELSRTSNRYLLDILEPFHRLQYLHERACVASQMPPEVLAIKLLDWRIQIANTLWGDPLEDYRYALGIEGLAAYRKEALRRWHNLSAEQQMSPAAKSLADVALSAAKATGHAETAIAVQGRVLEFADHYIELARLYVRYGRTDEAIALLKRSVALFAVPDGAQVLDELARIYWSARRFADALEVMWRSFKQLNSLKRFRYLKVAAERLGLWPAYRARVVRHFQHHKFDRSAVVEMYLSEGQFDEAWRHAAGDCDELIRLRLAEASEALFPGQALAVYRDQIERSRREGLFSEHFDEEIANWFRGVGRIMCSRGETEGFKAYVRLATADFAGRPLLLQLLKELAEL